MGSNASWGTPVSESGHGPYPAVATAALNASSAQIGGINRSAHGIGTPEDEEYREEQTYRYFTTVVQVVIFIGSLLGKATHLQGSLACLGLVYSTGATGKPNFPLVHLMAHLGVYGVSPRGGRRANLRCKKT